MPRLRQTKRRVAVGPLMIGLLMIGLVVSAAHAEPCCGPVTPQGERLAQFLDGSDVMQRWQSGWHVDWRTGAADRTTPGGPQAKTHCSAFVAAMAERLGIYVLRPPEHPQNLLANAQMRWLRDHGTEHGWRSLPAAADAQAAANRGQLVLEAFENPDPHRPGHIAIVRPSGKTRAELDRDGPQETQAGERNALRTTTQDGFRHHKGAWTPGGSGGLRYYAHAVTWS
ncbi:MAG: hypothetical protein WDN25_11935 [Acetobacteraceae bacterium]